MLRTYRGLTPEDLDRMPADRFLMLLPTDQIRRSGPSRGMSLEQARRTAELRRAEVASVLEDLLEDME